MTLALFAQGVGQSRGASQQRGQPCREAISAITQQTSKDPLPVQHQLFQMLLQDPSAGHLHPVGRAVGTSLCRAGCRCPSPQTKVPESVLIRTKILWIADFIHRLNHLHSAFVLYFSGFTVIGWELWEYADKYRLYINIGTLSNWVDMLIYSRLYKHRTVITCINSNI